MEPEKYETSVGEINDCIENNGSQQIIVNGFECCGLSIEINKEGLNLEKKTSGCENFNQQGIITSEKDSNCRYFKCDYKKS